MMSYSSIAKSTLSIVRVHKSCPCNFTDTNTGTLKNNADLPDASVLQQMTLSTGGVEKLVKEFLEAQSLTILPQNAFGDAVAQFVDKDDKNAMEAFLVESLDNQVKHLLRINNDDIEEEDILHQMDAHRAEYEENFAKGQVKKIVSVLVLNLHSL